MATLTPVSNMSDTDLEKNPNISEASILKFCTFSPTYTEKEKDTETVPKQNWFRRQMDSFKPAEGEIKVLQPQLSTFALQMIAIGGSIGTGLFIGSGEALVESGAGGLLICYTSVSFMIYFMMQSLSELACTFPVPGAFSYYATNFIDRSWGFAIGWNYFMQWLILLPLELSAASMTFKFWNNFPIPDFWLITIFFLMIIAINMMPVKIYGYAEIIFSLSKVFAIIGFLIIGTLILFGCLPNVDPVLAKYWKNPGPFSNNGFKGIVSVFVTASFSFSGTEMCGLCAAETSNPRKTIPKASKQVFWRILFFYISTLVLVGFLVPYNDPRLAPRDSNTNVNSSPLVIALEISKIPGLPSIMNVVILISILSVGNSAIYAASRTMVCLSDSGTAPKIFGTLDRKGRPIFAILITLAFGCLAYITLVGDSAYTMFTWLLSISGLSSLFTWASIGLAMIKFRMAMKAQNRPISELGFISITGLFGAWFTFLFCVIVLVAQLWIAISPSNKPANIENFFKVYLGAFVILLFFISHKIYVYITERKFELGIPPSEMDIISGRKEEDIESAGLLYQAERQGMNSKPWYYRLIKIWC